MQARERIQNKSQIKTEEENMTLKREDCPVLFTAFHKIMDEFKEGGFSGLVFPKSADISVPISSTVLTLCDAPIINRTAY